jgi:DNA-binding transcriptional LysR family regulator
VDRNECLQEVRAFVEVAERRHVGRAAEALGVSRNTVAIRLSAYEHMVGRLLIDRSHRRVVTLTAAGEAVLPLARRLLAAADAHDQEVLAVGEGTTGVVRIATPEKRTALMDFLVLAVEALDSGWRVDVQTRPPWALRRAFAYGEIDCAFTAHRPPDPNAGLLDPRPRNFERIDGLRIGSWSSGLYVSWRTRWTGAHADRLIGTARAAAHAIRRAEVLTRRAEYRRAHDLAVAAVVRDIERRWAGAERLTLSPGATGSRPGR